MTLEALSDERRRAVETFIADWLTEHRIPGAALAIVDGDSVTAEGFGARTLETNTPVTPDTLYGIGSCTKPFTATAIMQLVEADTVGLDDPVAEYLPHLADAPGDPITVEQLLSHTSGMPSDGIAVPLTIRQVGGGGEVPLSSAADFRRHVQASTDRRVTDRETFFYYNSGYAMLGKLIETVTGRSFAAYLDEEVLTPLGMERATFDRDAFEADDDRMTPYVKQDGESTETRCPFDPLIYAGGGLVSSVRDLAEYMRHVLGGERVGTGEHDVLTAESLAAMTTPAGRFGQYFDGRDIEYGYGVMLEDFLDDRLAGHRGSFVVSNAWFGYLENAEVGVSIACTTGPETHPMDAGRGVLALLQGHDPERVNPHHRLMRALETATGEYTGHRDIVRATIERVGGGLTFQMENDGGGMELLLMPTRVEEDVLVCTVMLASGTEREARFEFDGDCVDLFYERYRLTKPI